MDRRFEELLVQYAEAGAPEERTRIERTLWREFGAARAVFVMDMSGFSLLTQRYGIVHYLSMVKRMTLTAQPLIERHGGEVVKFEADNCFAAFPDVLAAVRAGIALNAAYGGMNEATPDELDIRVSIGIDYGDVLQIGGPDYFGEPVNRASKLGEDLAGPGEILVTEKAFRLIPAAAGLAGSPLSFSIAGLQLPAVKIAF
jgi:class 3 adenylate cyclase